MGTPNADNWPEFTQLPNFGLHFPVWKKRDLRKFVPDISTSELDLLDRLLCVNPHERITAADALRHCYFDGIRGSDSAGIPQMVDFKRSYLGHLRKTEEGIYPLRNFMENQSELNSGNLELCTLFSVQTLYLSCIDRRLTLTCEYLPLKLFSIPRNIDRLVN
jgi:serine/threonine protein kinase